jgi:phosphoadenosine phosphosulfate reductase
MAVPMTPKQIAAASESLQNATPQAILHWAVDTFFPKLTMATAFGAEGCCLIHMLAEIEPRVRLFNLDTGYQFAETLELRERIRKRYGIEVEFVRPDTTVAEYEAEHGGPLYRHRISAIRSEQTADRARAGVVAWDAKFSLVKVNPLLAWSKKDVWNFVLKNDVPYNPLHDQGYPSIGCWPCTAAVANGEDERAGRWAGTHKKECGLHVIEHQGGSGI